jgi:hypothetical protein
MLTSVGAIEACEHRLDGGAGRDFALILAPNAVGEGEEPTMSLLAPLGPRENVTDIVFVVVTHPSGIGSLSKLKVEHS